MFPQTGSANDRAMAQAAPQVRPNINTSQRPAPQTFSLDQIITTMVNAAEGVSDLLFVVGRPPQIEGYVQLRGVDIAGLHPALQPPHMEAIARKLMQVKERLAPQLTNFGLVSASLSAAR